MRKLLFFLISALVMSCQTSPDAGLKAEKKIAAARINDRLGMAYLERQDIKRAKQKFLFALEQAPQIPEAWYSMAYFLESTGNKQQARKYYLKALSLAPLRGDVLNNYGTFLCRAGEYRQAVLHFLKATEDSAYLEQASAFENAGLCSLKIPDKKKAIAYFRRALEEDPARPNALIELSELNYQQGDYSSARKQLNLYLQVASPSAQSYLLEKKLDEKMRG